jgi:hypothetical protein
VHALLRHLYNVASLGAPCCRQWFDEQGREIVINPAPWSDDAMNELGSRIRQLHNATASFHPPVHDLWRTWFGREVGTPDIIWHCDTAPWNVISRQGKLSL